MSVTSGSGLGTSPAGSTGAPIAPAARPVTGLSTIEAFSLTLNRNASSAALTTAKKVVDEWIKQAAPSISRHGELSVLPIDTSVLTHLAAPGIIIALYNRSSGIVAYHVALLEAGIGTIEPRTEQINGISVQRERYFEEIYDAEYVRAVRELIKSYFDGFKIAMDDGTSSKIPREFNWENADGVRTCLTTMVNLVLSDMLRASGVISDIDLTQIGTARPIVRYAFNSNDGVDAVGNPVRADIVAKLSVSTRDNRPGSTASLNSGSGETDLARGYAFIEPVWVGDQNSQNANNGAFGGQVDNRRFIARVVMSFAESLTIQTPAMAVLATLVQMSSIGEGANWYRAFRPTLSGMAGKDVNMRDIGALNIEGNLSNDPSGYGAPIDTSSNTFGDRELGAYVRQTFRPEVVYSADVSTMGMDRAGLDILVAAASGSTAAQAAILDAADKMTGGHFKRVANVVNAVVNNNEVVVAGYYDGRSGRRDVRDFDYLAVMNLAGRQNPAIGAEWAKATASELLNPLERLNLQKKIISQLSGNTAVFTGTTRRVTFTAEFTMALLRAIKAAGINISVAMPDGNADFNVNRPVQSWINAAGVNGMPSGTFTYGGQPTGQGGYGGFSGTGRSNW